MKKCKFCPSILTTNADYLAHIETVHKNTNDNNSCMCSDCGRQFRTRSELSQHTKSKCGTIRRFKCKICGQELMSAGSLHNHTIRHHDEKRYMCRYCAKLFYTAGQLKVHERIHTQDKAYICSICNKGFCHRQSLITHSTLHTGIKPFQCEHCGNSFSCIGNLLKHRKTHADTCGSIPLTTHRVEHPSTKIKVKINTPTNTRLKTIEKTKELETEIDLIKNELDDASIGDKHFEVNQVKDQNDVSIKVEDIEVVEEALQIKKEENNESIVEMKEESSGVKKKKSTEFEVRFKQFVMEWKLENVKNPSCKICKKTYTNSKWLFRHVQEHGVDFRLANPETLPLSTHNCSCCKQSFASKQECLDHQQKAHSKILTCQDCNRIFANRNCLQTHINNHHKGVLRKTYSYICDKCGIKFCQKAQLNKHELMNCYQGPLYSCTICDKKFASAGACKNHMRIHDPEMSLQCKFCTKQFRWKGQLKIHERKHTGEKPFICSICPKRFAHRESLITHKTIHTGIKPHLCEGCGSRFSCIGNLIKHRVKHAAECGVTGNIKNQMD